MSEKNAPEHTQETPEKETPETKRERLRRNRAQRELMRKKKRQQMLIRIGIAGAVLLLVGGILFAAVRGISKKNEKPAAQDPDPETEGMEAVDVSKVLHLVFQSLIESTEAAFGQEDTAMASIIDQGHLTVDEFNGILEQLYQQGYMLIRISDLVETDSETGQLKEKELYLPAGKKPLIISQQNVNYDLDYAGYGLASRMVVDASGKVTCERDRRDGSVASGAIDVVPCVDAFVEAHPDFSYNNARGILGITGYNGLLGYRTDESLSVSENNRYAVKYGLFDTEEEKQKVQPVIEALKAEGWEFACNGYGADIVYTMDMESVKSDLALWKERVEPLVGETKILLYPQGTDIGGWSAYDSENETYQFLKSEGFRYFCAMDIAGVRTQQTEEYLRCDYQNLDGYRMYQDLYEDAGRFTGILDFSELYDQSRPSYLTATGGESPSDTGEASNGGDDGAEDGTGEG